MQSYMLISRRHVFVHADLHLCPAESCLLHAEFKVFIRQIQKELWGTFSQLWGTF